MVADALESLAVWVFLAEVEHEVQREEDGNDEVDVVESLVHLLVEADDEHHTDARPSRQNEDNGVEDVLPFRVQRNDEVLRLQEVPHGIAIRLSLIRFHRAGVIVGGALVIGLDGEPDVLLEELHTFTGLFILIALLEQVN